MLFEWALAAIQSSELLESLGCAVCGSIAGQSLSAVEHAVGAMSVVAAAAAASSDSQWVITIDSEGRPRKMPVWVWERRRRPASAEAPGDRAMREFVLPASDALQRWSHEMIWGDLDRKGTAPSSGKA